ncbi:MAG: SDR family oxidoreductase [Alphaproteobacteria bacterium]
MRILIIGGRGFVGRHTTAALMAAGHDVETPSRTELDLAKMDTAALHARLAGVDAVINCAGLVAGGAMDAVHHRGVETLLQAASAAGIRRLIHVSALGASPDGKTRYQRTKGAGEEALRAHPDGTLPECCVLRPSVIIGRGGASTAILSALSALPVTPLIGAGRVQPIHISDVTALVVRLAEGNKPPPRFLDVTGPEPMDIDAVAAVLGRWLGRPVRFTLRMPARLLDAMAVIGGIFPRSPLNPETLAMLRRGNTANADGITRILGRPPRPLAEALALDPADSADRQAARAYFLRPLLRISLALMWIATGLLSFGLYPLEKSYGLMAEIGLTGFPADMALFGAAALDTLLGALLLIGWRPVAVGAVQLAAMAAFTLLAAWLPAEYWLHPFAPLLKNLPIAAATLVMMALED